MKPVHVGVLGYGHFVRRIFLPRFKACPHIAVAGVYNRGAERRAQAEQDGYRVTGNLAELLAIPELEAIYIGTSNAAHKEQCIAGARAGKHIFCEKPLALSLQDVDHILSETRKAGVITHVNHGTPYSKSFLDFRRIVRERCGRVLHVWIRTSRGFGNWVHGARHVVVGNPAESGGWTFHHLCHALDEACILMEGRRAVKVYHTLQKSCAECPSEEIVNGIVTFDDGATALLSDGTTIGGFQDKGVMGVDADLRQFGAETILVTMGPPAGRGRPGILERKVETFTAQDSGGDDEKSIQVVAQYFAEAVRGGENRLLSFEFVRDQYRILAGLKESARTGQAVDI